MALRHIIDRLVTVIEFEEDSEKLDKAGERIDATRERLDRLGNTFLATGAALVRLRGAGRPGVLERRGPGRQDGDPDRIHLRPDGRRVRELPPLVPDPFRGRDRGRGRHLHPLDLRGFVGEVAAADVRNALHFQQAQLGRAEDVLSTSTSIRQAYERFNIQRGRETLENRDYMDLIARTAQVGEGQAEAFAPAIKRLSQSLAVLGVSELQMAGFLASASQIAPTVEEAGTQIESFFRNLLKTTPIAEKAYERMGTTIGKVQNQVGRGESFEFVGVAADGDHV